MEIGLSVAFALLRAAVAGRDVRFHSNEWANAGLVCFFLEFPGAVHVAMIGDGESGLLEFERPLDQIINPVCAVEKRIFGVAVQMNE